MGWLSVICNNLIMNNKTMKATVVPAFYFLLLFSCVSPTPEEQVPIEEEGILQKQVQQDLPIQPPVKNEHVSRRRTVPGTVVNAEEKPTATQPPYVCPYNLLREDGVLILPDELKKIGGLSLSPDGQALVAVNGSDGYIFYLDKETGAILKKVNLKKRGDFESLEAVGDGIYLAKKNGSLVYATDLDAKKPTTKTFNSNLSAKNEVEGLAYDPVNNELLLACKGKAGNGDYLKDSRAVYVFQLEKKELFRQPMYLITADAIASYLEGQNMSNRLVGIVAENYPAEAYSPTCIAVHPHTGDIYLLSATGKLLVVLDRNSEIRHMETLDAFLFSQPNGMCFDEEGTLYISNHGGSGKGKIYRFGKRVLQ